MRGLFLLLATTATCATMPTVKLNNGVVMPMVQIGTGGYNSSYAKEAVTAALEVGFTGIDTAHDYNNQDGVGEAIVSAKATRGALFVTTKVPGCEVPGICAARTRQFIASDLKSLGMDQVDLLLLHYTPLGGCSSKTDCTMVQTQWAQLEAAYKAGQARAIGVSNFCKSCFVCLNQTMTVTPAVNQVQYHVGMGADPQGLRSYMEAQGIVFEAYSPLGSGSQELIAGDLTSGIAAKYNKTSAQVALRWIAQRGVPLACKAHNPTYLAEDADIFSWSLADDDMAALDAAAKPKGKPCLFCSK